MFTNGNNQCHQMMDTLANPGVRKPHFGPGAIEEFIINTNHKFLKIIRPSFINNNKYTPVLDDFSNLEEKIDELKIGVGYNLFDKHQFHIVANNCMRAARILLKNTSTKVQNPSLDTIISFYIDSLKININNLEIQMNDVDHLVQTNLNNLILYTQFWSNHIKSQIRSLQGENVKFIEFNKLLNQKPGNRLTFQEFSSIYNRFIKNMINRFNINGITPLSLAYLINDYVFVLNNINIKYNGSKIVKQNATIN